MISAALASRYASALVDVVLAPGSTVRPEQAMEQLRAFEAALGEAPGLRLVLASPAVSAARKRAVIRRIADALGLAPVIRNFILVLSDHRRASALHEMIAAFERLADERQGLVAAEVRTAYELNQDQQQKLAGELSRIAGAQVRMHFTVDSDLIGGVTARIGSKVYDGSVRGRLAGMRQRLVFSR